MSYEESKFGDGAPRAQLKLVTVLFRHGDRTPEVNGAGGESYPTDPTLDPKNNFFPVGPGGLTNEGKKRELALGRALRCRYDSFLGPTYYPAVVKARSTDYERTKMSLQLVLYGIFPPVGNQQWESGACWQPIPTDYWHKEKDCILRPDLCPKSIAASSRYQASKGHIDLENELLDLAKHLSEVSGEKYTSIADLAFLYIRTAQEDSLGHPIPDYLKGVYPKGQLLKAAAFFFGLQNGNDEIRRLYGGKLLRKITDDFKNVRDGTITDGRKLYLYSAHDINVAALLSTLGIWEAHMPQYSSAVITELWENEGKYYIKIVRWLGIPPEFVEVTLPGCEKLCLLEHFLKVKKNVIATDEDLMCH
ncbi:venom acid phosphatase Acph-1-like [Athalia rosae]|uniref:venom acid phosphatase Acph-1-like n=1 Tax=Athalia rosae TaxID=37344 RepID=UPI0020343CE6|nr:venom acid phosphatase Acph-1-like [Athalia rosae]